MRFPINEYNTNMYRFSVIAKWRSNYHFDKGVPLVIMHSFSVIFADIAVSHIAKN